MQPGPRLWPNLRRPAREKGKPLKNREKVSSRRRFEGLRFECTQCGQCCRRRGPYAHVYITEDELEALAAHLGDDVAAVRQRYTFRDEFGYRQLRFQADACVFLDTATGRCRVYEARPLQCRTFPFWPELIGRRGWKREARRICEGVGRGAAVPAPLVAEAVARMEGDE